MNFLLLWDLAGASGVEGPLFWAVGELKAETDMLML